MHQGLEGFIVDTEATDEKESRSSSSSKELSPNRTASFDIVLPNMEASHSITKTTVYALLSFTLSLKYDKSQLL
jgi:hypothetical protein